MSNRPTFNNWYCCRPSLSALKREIREEKPEFVGAEGMQQFLRAGNDRRVRPACDDSPDRLPSVDIESPSELRRIQLAQESGMSWTGYAPRQEGLPDVIVQVVLERRRNRPLRDGPMLTRFSYDTDNDIWYEMRDEWWFHWKNNYKKISFFDHRCSPCGNGAHYTFWQIKSPFLDFSLEDTFSSMAQEWGLNGFNGFLAPTGSEAYRWME